MYKTVFLLAGLLSIQLSSWAQKGFTTTSISIFKDGSAFFEKRGTVKTDKGTYFIKDDFPKAAFGTLWVGGDKGELKGVQSHTVTTTTEKEITSHFKSTQFKDMLRANLNKEVTLVISEQVSLTGMVEKVDEEFVLVHAKGAWVNMRISDIARINFSSRPNLPDSTKVVKQPMSKTEKGVLLSFNSEKLQQTIELMYLERGLGWLPSYHIQLRGKDKAQLQLQAEVVNDAEDIDNTDINFVVGVPNFVYGHQLSPLASTDNADRIINQIYSEYQPSRPMVQDFANRGASRITYGIDLPNADEGSSLASLEGSATEDLFFYQAKNVTLKQGGRAFLSILSAEVPVQHIWEVNLNPNGQDQYYRNNLSFSENYKNKVWHTLKIKNSTKSPLTAGPVLVTKNVNDQQKPISQDKVTYTPIGGESFIKLTVAPDVSVRDAEKEVGRESRIKKIGGYDYDELTIEGQIKVQNNKSEAIDLNVRRAISGRLQTSGPDWLLAPRIPVRGEINETTDVCWELKLRPGEKKEVKYSYKIYIRSY